jgi:hypothetical protein
VRPRNSHPVTPIRESIVSGNHLGGVDVVEGNPQLLRAVTESLQADRALREEGNESYPILYGREVAVSQPTWETLGLR